MSNLKCPECGTVLPLGANECPQCGCPIPQERNSSSSAPVSERLESPPQNVSLVVPTKTKKKISFAPWLIRLIGIMILFLGVTVVSTESNLEPYNATTFDVDSAMFGGDFYTEIYGATDTIVDELSAINGAAANLSASLVAIPETIYFCSRMVIIAIGLSVIALSFAKAK